jgi:hypothetical protein
MIAENCLFAWHSLLKPELLQKTAYFFWQTLQITGVTVQNCLPAWQFKKPDWLQKTTYISDKLYNWPE